MIYRREDLVGTSVQGYRLGGLKSGDVQPEISVNRGTAVGDSQSGISVIRRAEVGTFSPKYKSIEVIRQTLQSGISIGEPDNQLG